MNDLISRQAAIEAMSTVSDYAYTRGWNDAIKAAQEWTPIKEELPDNGQRVLVYYKYSGEVKIDTYSDGDGCYFEDNGDMDGITHWMPLSEKPKEEEK